MAAFESADCPHAFVETIRRYSLSLGDHEMACYNKRTMRMVPAES